MTKLILVWALCNTGPMPPGKSPCLYETYTSQQQCVNVETAFFQQMTGKGIPPYLECKQVSRTPQ